MSKNVSELREKLLERISNTSNHENINRYIRSAVTTLIQHKMNGHLIVRFIEKCMMEIESSVRSAAPGQAENLHIGYKILSDAKQKLMSRV